MIKFIGFGFFILLALGLFAQEAKPETHKYACDGAVVKWEPSTTKPTWPETFAAGKDCSQKNYDGPKVEAVKNISRHELANTSLAQACRERSVYREDGTDAPFCNVKGKEIPPDIKILRGALQDCQATGNRLSWCDRLIPLSEGKNYPPAPAMPTK